MTSFMRSFPSLAFLSLFASVSASADECATLYARRAATPAEAVSAAECYAKFEVDLDRAERISIALTWAIRKSGDKAFRLLQIARGRELSGAWITKPLASAHYWRSVFATFEANVRDEGATLPTHMLRALPRIRADLREAMKSRADTHFFGPARVLGVIDLSAPVIVGGDPERAFRSIGDALAGSPKSTLNQLWYAKALIRLRRVAEARTVLKGIVDLPSRDFDPDWILETEEDRVEAAKILGALP